MAWQVISAEATDPTCTAALAGGGLLLGAPVRLVAADDRSDASAEILVTVLDGRLRAESVTVRSASGVSAVELRRIPVATLMRSLVADHADLTTAQRRPVGREETTALVVRTWRELSADPATARRPTAATAERLYLSRKYVERLLTAARKRGLL